MKVCWKTKHRRKRDSRGPTGRDIVKEKSRTDEGERDIDGERGGDRERERERER